MEWENIFVKYRTKIYKELYNLIDNNSTKQWTEKLNRLFQRSHTNGQQVHEKLSNITSHQKTTKNTMIYHLTPVRVAVIKTEEIHVAEIMEKREALATLEGM